MEHADQLGTTGRSGRLNGVVRRNLYLVKTRSLIPPAPAVAVPEEAAPLAIITAEWDAPISLWWDRAPYEEPQ